MRPDYVDAHGNLGHALRRLHRYEAAVQCFDRARQLDPTVDVSSMRLYCLQQLCDWRGRAQELETLTGRIARGEPACNPFLYFSMSGSAALQLELAASWAEHHCTVREAPAPPPPPPPPANLRIGDM